MGPQEVKRVVIDTNVLVSALLFKGVPGELIECWKQGQIISLTSKKIIAEFIRVLSYPKFKLSEEEINVILQQEVLPWFEVVEVRKRKPYVLDDPDDDKFIWCGLAGKADCIISGDEHLLNLKPTPIQVLTPASFLSALRKNR